MADVIQFNCPACATMLRLPLQMAASQGPCPCCNREIIAPDPYRGIGAHLPPPPPQPTPVESFRPFADSPPLASHATHATVVEIIENKPQASPSPEPEPEVAKPSLSESPSQAPPETTSRHPSTGNIPWVVFVLSLLLTAVVCLVTGYFVGLRSNWLVANTPFPKLEIPQTIAEPPTKTVLVQPPPSESPIPPPEKDPAPPLPEDPPAQENIKASAMAETALKAFLDAPDWTTRSAYVLLPEKMRAAMQAYSQESNDGPTPFESISVENSYTDKDSGSTLFIFKVTTKQHPQGFPVAVAETSSGWQVDWESFIEFRDDLFKSFVEGPAGKTGRFHLIVSTPPQARAANTENEHFSSFLLDPPLPGRQRMAYVKKTSEIHGRLKQMTTSGIFTPVLEVAKRTTPDGKSYLEITRIIAKDWLPVGK